MTLSRRQVLLTLSGLPFLAGCTRTSSGNATTSARSATATSSVTVSPTPSVTPGVSTPKKGVGAWEFDGVGAAMIESGATWYLDWQTTPLPEVTTAEFVPMIWGVKETTEQNLEQATRNGRRLMGFNEPDHPDQANMSVATALHLWPKLQDTGLPLGSPACAGPADTSAWLAAFMDGAHRQGSRVDFLCVHSYASNFEVEPAVASLKAYLQRIDRRFGIPIWLTEWAMINWSSPASYPNSARQGEYAAAAIAMMEELSIVERYAWYSLPHWDRIPTVGLFDPGPRITPAGKAFGSAG